MIRLCCGIVAVFLLLFVARDRRGCARRNNLSVEIVRNVAPISICTLHDHDPYLMGDCHHRTHEVRNTSEVPLSDFTLYQKYVDEQGNPLVNHLLGVSVEQLDDGQLRVLTLEPGQTTLADVHERAWNEGK